MTATSPLSNRGVARAALVVIVGFLASGVLGLIRQAIVSAIFGTSIPSDAFLTAQRIPELVYNLVAGGALGSAFIPVFARYLRDEDDGAAWRLASAVITLASVVAAAASVIVVILAPWLVSQFLAPGREPAVQALITDLTRIMMLTPFIFSISGLLMGILQTFGSFLLPSLAISMNSVGIILGALVFAYWIPAEPNSLAVVNGANVYGLAWGAVLSAGLHLLVQLPALLRLKTGEGNDGWARPAFSLRPLLDWRVPGVREVLLLMGPRVLGLGIAQLNFIVNASFASGMVAGSYTALVTAWTLMFTALGVIGQSAGTAVFPTLSRLAADGDMTSYIDRLAAVLRSALFLALPVTAGMIVFGAPVIALVFERGAWTPDSTAAAAWALAFYGLGLVGHAGLEVLSRAFYALADTRTPVVVGVVSLLSNIVLSVIFIRWIGTPGQLTTGPFAGLALANSVTTLLEALALWWLLRRRIGSIQDGRVWDSLLRTAGATGALLAVLLLARALAQPPLVTVLLGTGLGALVFFGAAYLLRLEEVRSVLAAVRRRLKR
jgi:putative peptidoglycan lipid II flippase